MTLDRNRGRARMRNTGAILILSLIFAGLPVLQAGAGDDDRLRAYLLRLHTAGKCKAHLPHLGAQLDAALAHWRRGHLTAGDEARLNAYAEGRAGRKAKADIDFLYQNTAAGDPFATAKSCVKTLHGWQPLTYPVIEDTRFDQDIAQERLRLVAPLALGRWNCPMLDRVVAEQPPVEPRHDNDIFETWVLQGCGQRYALRLRLHVEGLAQKIAIHDEDIADLVAPTATVPEDAQ